MERSKLIAKKIESIVKDLSRYRPEKIILFGSSTTGKMDEFSDLDFVVIKKTDRPFIKRLVEAAEFVRSDLHPFDIFVYTPEEFKRMKNEDNPFIEQVLKKGKVVYEKTKGK